MSVEDPAAPVMDIAVVGSGIAGLSAAWLLSRYHRVTLFEAEPGAGGHSCTVEAPGPAERRAVDMGFIVYNEAAYPNLTALFAHLGVATRQTCMSLGVSLEDGAYEYGSRGLSGLLAQPYNALRPRFLTMMRDLVRFYRGSARDMADPVLADLTLGEYLDSRGYDAAFQRDHLLPQAAAIWSSSLAKARDYPVQAFVRFFENHGLLKLVNRPEWRTVVGGSRTYVNALLDDYKGVLRSGVPVVEVRRTPSGALLRTRGEEALRFDQVVLAVHSDQALALLADATRDERALLGDIRYAPNRVVLHADASLMPRRRAAWCSWNYVGSGAEENQASAPTVTYWMNRLQHLPGPPLFVSLNPSREPAPGSIVEERMFDHPMFDKPALAAQRQIWSLQGQRRTWFCGAWLGAGFHEDGLQSGLAVAEAIGGVRRPWSVENESGRIHLADAATADLDEAA